MKTLPCIELPVYYEVVRVRRMSPFHWALLRALQVFAPGIRPGMDELTRRLCIGEPVFLDGAWRDLLGWHAVDDAVFSQARLTLEGEEALRDGHVPLGPAVECTRLLYFTREGDWFPPGRRGEQKTAKPLRAPPPWGDVLTARRLEACLRADTGTEAIRPDERWRGIRAGWETAREVRCLPPVQEAGWKFPGL